MSGPVVIRRTGDVGTVKRLDRVCFPDDAPVKITDPRLQWWVGYLAGEPVCFAGARSLMNDTHIYLTRAGVVPGARGRGLQLRTIRARLAWARKHGHTGALTYTVSGNYWSANNLIRAGFKLYDPEWAWAGRKHGKDEVILYWCCNF